jgi:signal peptidase I
MEQTLPVGSYIAVREDAAVGRGDIIVHRMPDVPGGTFTRRVVAIGGDTIACCEGGNVVLNGEELREPYVFEDDRQPFGPVTVPPSRLFVLGDHRSASSDSRSYLNDAFSGTVAEGDVIGVASGPYGRARAHVQPLVTALPYLVALGLVVGLATALAMRRVAPARE